jgi:alanyl-tRNA synthetase
LNVAPLDVPGRAAALVAEVGRLQRQVAQLSAAGPLSADSLLAGARQIDATRIVVAETPGANHNVMRQTIDQLRKTASPIAVLLAARQDDDKVVLVAGLSHDLVKRGLSAGAWVGEVAKLVGGGGGGKPDLAQAGGKSPEKLPEALAFAHSKIGELLAE